MLPYSRLLETIQGVCNNDRGVSGDISGIYGPMQSVHHTETLVPACIRMGAQPLLDRYVKGQVGLLDYILVG